MASNKRGRFLAIAIGSLLFLLAFLLHLLAYMAQR